MLLSNFIDVINPQKIRSSKINKRDNNVIFTKDDSLMKIGDNERLCFNEHKNKFLVDDLTYNGNTKYMGMCKFNDNPSRRIDIRLISLDCYGAALLYFTGSGEFNKNMRTYALKNGYTINEYAVKHTDTKKKVKHTFHSEKDIFDYFEFQYVDPENR